MRENKIYPYIKMALLISLIVISSYIYIPVPPVSVLSFQTVAVNLTAFLLPPSQSFVTVAVWLLMGAAGLPVFSSGAGIGKLFGVTGGFYLGFLIAAPVMSLLKGSTPSLKRYFAAALSGLIAEHFCAVAVMCIHNGFNIFAAFEAISLPFIPGDILKCAVSAFLALRITKAIKENGAVR